MLDNDELNLPQSCNGVIVTVQGNRGAPKRIYEIEFEQNEKTPSLDQIEKGIALEEQNEAILEAMGFDSVLTKKGTVFEIEAKIKFIPNDSLFEISLTIVFPLSKDASLNSEKDLMMQQMRELHSQAIETISIVSQSANNALASISTSHNNSVAKTHESHASAMAEFSSSIATMQTNVAAITDANTKLVQQVFVRMEKLEVANENLRIELSQSKVDNKSSEIWGEVFKSVMPSIVPKALDAITALNAVING